MARSLKTRGLEELGTFRRRIERQYTLRRILRSDRDALIGYVDLLEARITRMTEKNETGMEEFDGS